MPKISSSSIIWAKRSELIINASEGNILKEDQTLEEASKHMIAELRKNQKKIILRNVTDSGIPNQLEIASLGRDTIRSYHFSPETEEEVLDIYINDFLKNNNPLRDLRIIQIWAWDEKKRVLNLYNLGLKAFHGGNYGFKTSPLFLRYYDE